MMNIQNYVTDVCIIGAGVIGLSVARNLSYKYPNISIKVIEKEYQIGQHTSGRNSGVLHAGFYYSSDSLKAQFCKQGNKQWRDYCENNKLKINKCGKLVVCQDENQIDQMSQLYLQGLKNGVDLQLIPYNEAKEMEPNLRGKGDKVLYSPTTAVVDNKECLDYMVQEISRINTNFQILYNSSFLKQENENTILLQNNRKIEYNYLVNCAGQQSLEIAQSFGIGNEYSIFPMKGVYSYSETLKQNYKMCVYPVPIKGALFLGVHSTMTPYGELKIGPAAIPAFSLENYQGLENINWKDFQNIFKSYWILLSTKSQRPFIYQYLRQEVPKFFLRNIVNDLKHILDVDHKQFIKFSQAGIRAQLVDTKKRVLVNDFLIEKSIHKQIHILNAVSPGWTCAMPMAEEIIKQLKI